MQDHVAEQFTKQLYLFPNVIIFTFIQEHSLSLFLRDTKYKTLLRLQKIPQEAGHCYK